MQVEARIFGQRGPITVTGSQEQTTNAPITPPALLRQRDWVFQHIAVWMRNYSMAYVDVKIEPAGVIPVSNVAFQPLDDAHFPASLKIVRTDIVRMLKLLFERYCISSFRITLTKMELEELRKYWQYLDTGDQSAADALRYKDVKLQYERDPQPKGISSENEQQQSENQEQQGSTGGQPLFDE